MKNEIFYYFGKADNSYREFINSTGDLILSDRTIPRNRIVQAEQVHKDEIAIVNKTCGDNTFFPGVDALITREPDIYLMIRTADCVPVFLHDNNNTVIAALHCGREGTRRNLAAKTVSLIQDKYTLTASDLSAYLGPGICGNHYQVDGEIFKKFIIDTGIRQVYPYIDLYRTIEYQLMKTGLLQENIHLSKECTYISKEYFSYHQDQTEERQINVICIGKGF